jgi:O-acetyl-ADP-ribose deacetylase (regulator of RNase III)
MIEYKAGNLLAEEVEALINTVNCVGVMGRGVALQFKKKYPQNYKAYATACKQNEVQPGRMFIVQISQLINPKYIINFPTKRHWKGKSRLEDIDAGLQSLVKEIQKRGISSIAMPLLGCGLGGLDWKEVKPRIEAAFADLSNISVVIFEPNTISKTVNDNFSTDVPAMTQGRATLVALMQRYLAGLLDPFISLLEAQKLMYFLQEAGQPLRLNYKAHLYGPYADNLRHVLKRVEGHLISGYADGDEPNRQLTLVSKAAEDALAFLHNEPEVFERFNRVVDLVDGFETPFGLELLATVHWVVTKQEATSPEDALIKVYAWNERKKQFSERQIRLAYETLNEKKWFARHDSKPDAL